MRILLHLKPSQQGTKKLLAEYGNRFVWVRYRYDARTKKHLKTVELIVAESAWEPETRRYAAETIVGSADWPPRSGVAGAGEAYWWKVESCQTGPRDTL